LLQQKMDLLEVLGDIEMAQELIKKGGDDDAGEVDHPLDINYKKLNNPLKPLDRNSKEWKHIQA